MSDDLQTPDNNLVLRNLQGMRRDMHERVERQAHAIELTDRPTLRVDELSARTDKGFADVRSDLILMENKVLSTQTDIMYVVRRLGEANAGERLPLDP